MVRGRDTEVFVWGLALDDQHNGVRRGQYLPYPLADVA